MSSPGDITSEWIRSVRPPRNSVDPHLPYAFCWDQERSAAGRMVDVATIFLTNRECPWKCLMCDLWKNTTETSVPDGAIPQQIRHALESLEPRRSTRQQIKLYNSGSFFDAKAVPLADHPSIAALVQEFDRVIVECHPALIDDQVLAFRDLLGDVTLEVAMGLETVDPQVLPRLNKGITLDSFREAAAFLTRHAVDVRTFVLIQTPWQDSTSAVKWATQSVEFSMECGATVAALIPTRFGNGALEALAASGEFTPPTMTTIEDAFTRSLTLARDWNSGMRVFVDLWDLEQFSNCNACFGARQARLEQMNVEQVILPPVECEHCSR